MKLEINDSEIIEHWVLTTEENEIEIIINGKKLFVGKINKIDWDIETRTKEEDYLLGCNREVNFIIKATKGELHNELDCGLYENGERTYKDCDGCGYYLCRSCKHFDIENTNMELTYKKAGRSSRGY